MKNKIKDNGIIRTEYGVFLWVKIKTKSLTKQEGVIGKLYSFKTPITSRYYIVRFHDGSWLCYHRDNFTILKHQFIYNIAERIFLWFFNES